MNTITRTASMRDSDGHLQIAEFNKVNEPLSIVWYEPQVTNETAHNAEPLWGDYYTYCNKTGWLLEQVRKQGERIICKTTWGLDGNFSTRTFYDAEGNVSKTRLRDRHRHIVYGIHECESDDAVELAEKEGYTKQAPENKLFFSKRRNQIYEYRPSGVFVCETWYSDDKQKEVRGWHGYGFDEFNRHVTEFTEKNDALTAYTTCEYTAKGRIITFMKVCGHSWDDSQNKIVKERKEKENIYFDTIEKIEYSDNKVKRCISWDYDEQKCLGKTVTCFANSDEQIESIKKYNENDNLIEKSQYIYEKVSDDKQELFAVNTLHYDENGKTIRREFKAEK
ncbi:MAG: hypothetical protein IKV41_02650 [Oscillospiraceae bacterium]|nr:hypothetical protein [Oscillospiraceae bacterium]